MLAIVLLMAVIIAAAVVVLLYVAYPHRGEDVPKAPWLGHVLQRLVDSATEWTSRDAAGDAPAVEEKAPASSGRR